MKDREASQNGKLPTSEVMSYGSGIIAYMFCIQAMDSILSPLIILEYQFSPMWFGVVIGIVRGWDAFSDPVVGQISDSTRSRWGRRRPYLLAGACLCGLFLPLITLLPATIPEGTYFIILGFLFIVFYTFFTIYAVPYLSLGYEISPDPSERVRVQAYRAVFLLVPGVLSGWFYRASQAGFFESTVEGIRWMAICVGVCILVTGLAPALFCRERYYKVAVAEGKAGIWKSIASASTNRPFITLMGTILILQTCVGAANGIGGYTLIFYVYDGDTLAGSTLSGLAQTVSAVSSVAFILFTRRLSDSIGKKNTLALCIVINMVGNFSQWFLVNPDKPYLALISYLIIAPGVASFWVVANAMKADVCDWDEYLNNKRREGIYASFANWIQKGSSSISAMLVGFGLAWIGFDATLGGGQSPSTILAMRICLSIVPGVFLLLCLILLAFYPLKEDRMRQIRIELEARRGTV